MDLRTDVSVENDAELETSTWNGYDLASFELNGHQCTLVAPHTPSKGNPWIWRTEFFGAFPVADIALLGKGLHVAYIDMTNMYGAPAAMPYMDEFYDHLTTNLGLSRKTALEGFSRGGLFAFNWAVRNPEKVACIYVDAPVCDFKSWPAGHEAFVEDWEICKQVYGLTEEQAMAYTGNPVDNLEPLAKAGISILSVCGADDAIVPMEENTRVVEKRYLELGGDITVITKPLCNHHPHSLEDPAPIVDFVLQHI